MVYVRVVMVGVVTVVMVVTVEEIVVVVVVDDVVVEDVEVVVLVVVVVVSVDVVAPWRRCRTRTSALTSRRSRSRRPGAVGLLVGLAEVGLALEGERVGRAVGDLVVGK